MSESDPSEIIESYTKGFEDLGPDLKFGILLKLIDSLSERLSWDEYFMLIAQAVKNRSSCERLKVGCVITRNNRSLCTGYNGHVPGAPHNSKVIDGHEQLTIHAEVNAVCNAANNGISLNNSKAYVTHYPCINCAKSLIAAGISEIVYLEDYNNNPINKELFLSKGVKVNKMKYSNSELFS